MNILPARRPRSQKTVLQIERMFPGSAGVPPASCFRFPTSQGLRPLLQASFHRRLAFFRRQSMDLTEWRAICILAPKYPTILWRLLRQINPRHDDPIGMS